MQFCSKPSLSFESPKITGPLECDTKINTCEGREKLCRCTLQNWASVKTLSQQEGGG